MNLFPNKHNNRIFFRFVACALAGGAISGVLGIVGPHFTGWQTVGPGCLMLLVAIFVIPYGLRPRKP